MRLKKLGAVLVVVAALGAVLASSALAAGVTQDVKWYTGASPGTELSGSETIGITQVGTASLTTEIGTIVYTLDWTEVECVGCKIENSGGVAVGSGKLKFEEVSVLKPAGCSVAATIETRPLLVQVDWMAAASSEPNYVKLTPAAGEATEWATIEITGCALETTILLKGSAFGQTQNATGTEAVEQEVRFSDAINKAAGGTLHVGSKSAVLAASVQFEMSGAKAGTAFGTH
jgi:hypothetical protein